ncbi:hypothetical protein GCM10022256_14940 [Frondihabitans peucedani]|uniref:RNA-directed DNA polymerase n=1 Tax=Frondihabitans peucedani TaxID=598626 RepID=A0ABP8E0Z2_9MICO
MPPSPGAPRGTKIDQSQTPQKAQRAARARPPAPTDGSSGSRSHASAVAAALADAFLAAPAWSVVELTAAGHRTVGPRRRFVPLAVAGVLSALPRPPLDAPGMLARLVLGLDGFVDAVERSAAREPVRILSRAPVPTESTGREVRIDTVRDLADLVGVTVGRLAWFADTGGWNRRARDEPLHHYRYEWRQRPGRVPRLLEVPLPRLRDIQRIVLDEVLSPLPLHDAAHGFVAGRSAVTGAALHTGRQVVVSADLVSFFASVPGRDVAGVFRRAGLPEAVAHLLTGLCTHAVPVAVLSRMPDGGTSDERFRLRQRLAVPHLPQGAPTSPAVANLALVRLDGRLSGWAASVGASYTRYADDLAFSGDDALAARVGAFVRGVDRIVTDEGHTLNPAKTRVRRQGVRQSVTGIVVNATTSPGRAEHDVLKAILHNCVVAGPSSQNRDGHPEFRLHLLGRIAWIAQLHPARGARLRRQFDRIRW